MRPCVNPTGAYRAVPRPTAAGLVAWVALGLLFSLAGAAAAEEAGFDGVLIRLDDTQAVWRLVDGTPPAAGDQLRSADGLFVGQAVAVERTTVTTRLLGDAAGLRLGDRHRLTPATAALAVGSGADRPVLERTAPVAVVVRVAVDTAVVRAPDAPQRDQTAQAWRDGAPVATVTWVEPVEAVANDWLVRWQPLGDTSLRLGDAVLYAANPTAAPASASSPPLPARRDLPPPAERRPDAVGGSAIVPGDAPLYDVLAALAARGYVPNAARRQFDGSLEIAYTRDQLAAFVAPMIDQLLDTDRAWPIRSLSPPLAAQLLWIVQELRPQLAQYDLDVDAALARLRARTPDGFSLLPTGSVVVRPQTDELRLRAEASLFGTYGPDWRAGITFSTEGGEPFPEYHDRSTLHGNFVEVDLSRALTVGAGRMYERIGPGINGLLWSDRAKPMDELALTWRTRLFGRPFELHQFAGTFTSNARRFVTVRRYALNALDNLDLGLNFGLVTDKAGQAVATWFLPLYLARFVSGESGRGGYGNLVGSVDAAFRLNREFTLYGEMFADDFDFSPDPPDTAQRLGYLAGLHYTPSWALPGTSYRLEGTLIPDTGVYVGQQQSRLSWTREDHILGHEYGQDAAGFLVRARHRLSRRLDALVRYEYFTQLRDAPVSPSTHRLDFRAGFDLQSWWSLGVGFEWRQRNNLGAVQGNDQSDTAVFIESRAGL